MSASKTGERVCVRRRFPARVAGVLAVARAERIVLVTALLAACSGGGGPSGARSAGGAGAAVDAPFWGGGAGPAVTYAPVAWPTEPAPGQCGDACGEWLPYTRFQRPVKDPRTQDPSNGGTAPQNYVNVSSSCTDQALPSIYYAFHKDPTDPSKDVIFFRWRVEQAAHTYATGPSAGSYGASDPWSSALWTVLIDIDGSGYRQLAAHINGSSGSPSAPIDTLAAIYGKIPTQSIDYLADPANIKLLGTSPTAFVDDGTGLLLNFQNSLHPAASWPNGAAETTWDYGPTRARLVSTRPCTEYFVDYQIPVAMLDATAQGGPKVTRSTPISMLFCTANSLNNPLQKDCAIHRTWNAEAASPGPFGDYISFDQTKPYAQPIISKVTSTAPPSCSGTYTLGAQVQDSLYVNNAGAVVPSVKAVSFWYYYDADGDGIANDAGSVWTFAADAALVPGKLNAWTASWDSHTLARGKYLIGAQAVDDNTLVDDEMTPTGVNNRTFSYVTSDGLGQVYVNGSGWQITPSDFPVHSPALTPSTAENWYGNPLITGLQVTGTGVDVALNTCGVAPTLSLGGTPSSLDPGQAASFSVSVSNAGNPRPTNVSSISVQLPPGFTYVTGTTAGSFGSANPSVSGAILTWTFGAPVQVGAGATQTLSFSATATSTAGQYNATATAASSDGTLTSSPVGFTVYAAATTLTNTPSRYAVPPDGATQVVYTIAYGNASTVPLASASLTDTLPANVAFVGCSGGATCSASAGTVTWSLGTLAAGASGTATLTVTVGAGYTATSLADTATLSAVTPGGASVQRSAAATISVTQPVPLYALTASSSATTVAPSGTVTFTLSYANPGNGAAAGTLLVDTLPDGFAFSNCSVVTSAHFTSCTAQGNAVTFSGASGAPISLPAGASGTVTVTATGTTVAGNPFTYANPAVDRATLSGAAGVAPATASASVGVTGQYCSNVFYFHRGIDNQLATLRPANTTAPASGVDYSTAINSVTNNAFGTANQVAFLQDTGFAQSTDLSGQTATINFNLYAGQGGTDTQVVLQRVSGGTTTTMATSGTLSIGTNHNWYTYSFTVPSSTILAPGDKLQWLFQFKNQGGTKDITFFYDSTTYNSRSSFCTATAPAALTVTNSVDKAAIPGSPVDLLTYTLTAQNLGGTAASGVTLTDALATGMTGCQASTNGSTWVSCSSAGASPPSHTFSVGSLAAGASTTVYVRGTSPASPTTSTLVDTATLSGTGLATASASASTTVTSVGGGTPSLSVTAAADRGTVSPGQTVTYTVNVVNVGTAPATNVTVTDVVPATSWYHYVASSVQGGSGRSVSGNTLSWTLSSLAVGASAALTFQMAADATGLPDGLTTLTDLASASDASACTGATPPSGCTSNTVTVLANGSAGLSLSASGSPATVSPGSVLEYTLVVGSTGSSTATSVSLAAALPPHTRFRAVTAGSGSYDAVGNRVVSSLGSLASGGSSTVKFQVDVDATLPAGSTALTSTSLVSASNALQQTATVTTTGTATVQLLVSSAGPASLPGPAARLAAAAGGVTVLTVDSSALLEVGGYVLVGGTVSRVTGISGRTVSLASPVTAAPGAPLYRSAAYSVSTANQGTATANAVVLTAQVPSGWSYVAASPTPTSAPALGAAGAVTWSQGSLAAASVDAVQLVLIPTQTAALASTLSDPVQCLAPSTPGCAASTSTVVGGLTAVVKTSTPVVSGGQAAQYTITLSNSLGTDVGGVAVTDVLPSGFQYVLGTGTPAPGAVAAGQPTWSGLTVPANGSLQLTFQAAVSAGVGSGTYDDPITVTAGAGVGVTGFDALATTDDDVTVLNLGWNVAAGYVFRDRAPLGTLDGSDTGLQDVAVNIDDASGQPPYVVQTDGYGYFRQLVPGGGNWSVSVPAGQPNASVLAGLTLQGAYTSPVSVDVTTAAASALRFGYVSTSGPTQHTVGTSAGTGGSISPTSALVDDGSSTTFTVAASPGYAIESVTGCGGTISGGTYTTGSITADCTVTASFTPNPPASIAVVGGDAQATQVTTEFAQLLTVVVTDAGGVPVPGALVTFTAPALGASAAVTSVVATDSSGTAFTLAIANGTAGSYTVLAGVSGVETPVAFALTNLPGPAISLQVVSGGAQSTRVGTPFAQPLVVQALDAGGNPVPGVEVTFTAPGSGASATVTSSVTTDSSGTASTSATANGTAGSYTVLAGASGVESSAPFSLTNLPGPATSLQVVSGGTQSTRVGTQFAQRLVVQALDAGGNPVPGVTVTFAAPSQGASATVTATVTTDSSGTASTSATANATAGSYTVLAGASGVETSAPFSLTNLAGPATSLQIVSGGTQSTRVGTQFAQRLVVQALDAGGNPVPGVTVTFTAPGSGASATVTATVTTDSSGTASTSATANATAGSYAVLAGASGVESSAPFSLTNLPGPATSLQVVSGGTQSTRVGTQFAQRLVVQALDAGGNPVPGVTVTFTAPGSGASATVTSSVTTDSSGTASTSATANATAGSYAVLAGASGVESSAPFALTNLPGSATSLQVVSGGTQSTRVGTDFAQQLVVQALDADGNPVPGVDVTFTPPAQGASATVTATVTTDSSGTAATAATANATAGAYTVLAAVSGVEAPAPFSLTNLPGPATSLQVVSGGAQSTRVGTQFAQQLVVRAVDSGGNPVPGVDVTFTAPGSGPSATVTGSVATDSSGTASTSATANATAGAYTVLATASGVETSAPFSLTNLPGPAISLRLVSGGEQSTRIGTDFAQPLVAQALDADGNPVPGVEVTFTAPASSPGALLTPGAPVTTDALGQASVAATADGAPGTYAVIASITTGQEASFLLTNTSTDPLVVSAISGGDQTTTVGTDFGAPLVVRVTQDGFPVPGAAVTFSAPASGASATLSRSTVLTDADGYAQVSATATTVSGDYQVEASCPQAIAPASFAETNAPDAPVALVLSVGSSPQATQVGTPFGHALVATLVDGHGNPVPQRTVTFTPPADGASAALGATEATSDARGQVTITASANATAGSYAVEASASGVPPVSFLLTNLVGAPAYITVVSGTPQTAAARSGFAQPLVAQVTDLNGNPVPDAPVTWTVLPSSATAMLGAQQTATDADGRTQVLATAGAVAGRYEVTASVSDGAGPALFELANTAGAPATLTVDARTTPQSAQVETAFPLALRAHVADADGNPVAGVPVTFAPSTSEPTATLGVLTAVSDAGGDVSVEAVAGTTAGTYAVAATAAGLPPVTFTLTNLPVATRPPTLELRSGAGQTTVARAAFAEPLVLRVLDGDGAPLAGVTVHLALPTSGPGATAPDTAISDDQGEVRFVLTALDPLGTFTVSAAADGTASPVTAQFTVTTIPTVATVLVAPPEAHLGDTITLTAQVSSEHGTPPGSVRFTLDGAELATASLADGTASVTVAASTVGLGSHAVVARYAGADPFAPSTSASAALVVSADRAILDGGGGCASGGRGGGGGGWLALAAAAALLLRRRRRAVLAVLLAALVPARPARAQGTPDSPGAAVNKFEPGPAGSRWAAADSLSYGGNGRVTLRAFVDYARRPLVIYNADGSTRAVVLADQLWLHAGASVVLLDRVRLSFAAPFALHQSPRPAVFNGVGVEPARSRGIGDLTLGGDVLLLGQPEGAARFGAGVGVRVPTGAQGADLGDGHLGVSLHVNGAGRIRRIEWAAEAGYAQRSGARIGEIRFGPDIRAKVAAGVLLLDDALLIGPELYGDKDVGARATRPLSVEGDLGAQVRFASGWAVRAGIGTGLKRSAGIPDWRVLGGVEWSPQARAARREEPAPARQEEAAPTRKPDRAPAPAPAEVGSPIAPAPRAEPGEAAPRDPDRDGDGVPDALDLCPAEPAGAHPDPARPGCPLLDRDGDGVPDAVDDCPDEKGLPEFHGCKEKQLARLEGAKIIGVQPVHFRNDRAVIERSSFALLTAVARVLLDHPEISRVRVEGHTDSNGNRAHNVDLSQRRAEAVVSFLVGKGVARARLEARGFGPDRPIADNGTVKGRAANRRVEFILVGGEGTREE